MTGAGAADPVTASRRSGAALLSRGGSIPRSLFIPAIVGVFFLLLPLLALVARADWPALPAAIASRQSRQALWLSLRCGLAATAACLVMGVPMALLLARFDRGWVRLVRSLVTLPLVLPPMVGGIALLYLLGRNGLAGRYLLTFVGQIPFTTTAVVIAETFVALPFLVLSLEGSLRTSGIRFEVVAATLGARRWTVFRRVTLPMVGPGLMSATVLCFARALGEFGATALFAGTSALTRTMPIQIYTEVNGGDQNSAVALSLLLMLVALLILVVVRPRFTPGSP